MKVKVKGLVFVGFAAAVFAQSAFATITPNTAEKKIVTSKYYVDSTFQEEEDKVATTPTGNDAAEIWASSVKYPSMAVLKAKFDALTPAVGSNAENYVDFTESGDTLTVNFDNAPATAAADLTGYDSTSAPNGAALTSPNDKKLVTAGAVNSMILRESNGATTIDSNSTNGTVPTSKNVYDFVTNIGGNYQRKLGSTETGLYVGTYSSDNATTWKALETVAAASSQASTDYVTIMEDGGVYKINIPYAQIATHGADVTGDNGYSNQITSGAGTLATAGAVYEYVQDHIKTTSEATIANSTNDDVNVPTMKNVYDFVDGNYQPKTTGTDVMVGYNGTWRSLGGDSYITVAADESSSSVTLTNMTAHGVDDAGANPAYTSDFVAAGATGATTKRPMLARAGDVYDFVMDQMGGLAIPEMPDECTTAATNGGYCALVYGAKTGGGNALQWTVMAPAPSNP